MSLELGVAIAAVAVSAIALVATLGAWRRVRSLRRDQQAILGEESFAAGKWASEATIASLADYEKKLREKGGTIAEIDKAPFKAATGGVYQTLGYSDLRKDVDKALGK